MHEKETHDQKISIELKEFLSDLVVRTYTFNAGGQGSITGWGTKILCHIVGPTKN